MIYSGGSKTEPPLVILLFSAMGHDKMLNVKASKMQGGSKTHFISKTMQDHRRWSQLGRCKSVDYVHRR